LYGKIVPEYFRIALEQGIILANMHKFKVKNFAYIIADNKKTREISQSCAKTGGVCGGPQKNTKILRIHLPVSRRHNN